jgi:hypothetical protein
LHEKFPEELLSHAREVRIEIVSLAGLLEAEGPHLGRPHADTLKGSGFPNMKELRFSAAGGTWRVAYAFDPKRRAIILVAGDKSGVSSKLFYDRLIRTADLRFADHLHSTGK